MLRASGRGILVSAIGPLNAWLNKLVGLWQLVAIAKYSYGKSIVSSYEVLLSCYAICPHCLEGTILICIILSVVCWKGRWFKVNIFNSVLPISSHHQFPVPKSRGRRACLGLPFMWRWQRKASHAAQWSLTAPPVLSGMRGSLCKKQHIFPPLRFWWSFLSASFLGLVSLLSDFSIFLKHLCAQCVYSIWYRSVGQPMNPENLNYL